MSYAEKVPLVARALRQFFLAHLQSDPQYVSMPSQVDDELWHEFILYTRNYDAFCRRAFGRFMPMGEAVDLRTGTPRWGKYPTARSEQVSQPCALHSP